VTGSAMLTLQRRQTLAFQSINKAPLNTLGGNECLSSHICQLSRQAGTTQEDIVEDTIGERYG